PDDGHRRADQAVGDAGADMTADDMAIAVTRLPEALLSALRKLRDDAAVVSNVPEFTAHLWFEPLPRGGSSPWRWCRSPSLPGSTRASHASNSGPWRRGTIRAPRRIPPRPSTISPRAPTRSARPGGGRSPPARPGWPPARAPRGRGRTRRAPSPWSPPP